MGNILANVPDVHFLANKLWQGILWKTFLRQKAKFSFFLRLTTKSFARQLRLVNPMETLFLFYSLITAF